MHINIFFCILFVFPEEKAVVRRACSPWVATSIAWGQRDLLPPYVLGVLLKYLGEEERQFFNTFSTMS